MTVPFVGPSYAFQSPRSRGPLSVNLIPVADESGVSKDRVIFRDLPGLRVFASPSGEGRALRNINGTLYAIVGAKLYRVSSAGVLTEIGSLTTSTGRCGLTANALQVVAGDGQQLYVYTHSTGTFQAFAYPGKSRVECLDEYVLFIHRDSQQFGWTNIGDATSLDALNFASAEGSPDDLVDIIVDHREILLGGRDSIEPWSTVGGDLVFARNGGAFVEMGVASEFCMQKAGGSVFYVGSSGRGNAGIFRFEGYQPMRVSSLPVEQLFNEIDLTGSTAYGYDADGSSFYCLNVPSLDTTLVYDAKTGVFHDRAELLDGDYTKHRARMHAFAYGKHFVMGDSGVIYEMTSEAHDNAGDVLVRDRITPNDKTPARARKSYGAFHLDCDRGTGGTVMLRYSNDGGASWGSWMYRSLGATGDRTLQVKWERTGSARDRVWQVRVTDAVPFNPVNGGADG
jgi:hypothetical protein